MGIKNPEAVEILLKETNNLISLPEICLKLRDLLEEPDHSLDDVCRLIVHDPSLTTRVLRIVNSAYYGLNSKVSTINHALNVLGEEELNNLVIVTAIFKTLNNIKTKMNLKRFWQSSVYCAVLAQNIESSIGSEKDIPEDIFITALLLNVGKLLLYFSEPDLLECVESEVKEKGNADYIIEREHLGFNHADVGSLMAKNWNFSDGMIKAIANHHKFNGDLGPELPVLFTASLVSDIANFNNVENFIPEDFNFSDYRLPESLGLGMEDFMNLLDKSFQDYSYAYDTFCGN